MMVTVAPLPRVANTFPPGFSRMKAPPPSDALISAMIGVGSAVMVDVGVSEGGRVTSDVGFGVRLEWGACWDSNECFGGFGIG